MDAIISVSFIDARCDLLVPSWKPAVPRIWASSQFPLDLGQSASTAVMVTEILRIILIERQIHMDKDRIKGSAQQAKGAVKEVIGKVTVMPSSRPKARATRLPERFRTRLAG